MYQLENWQDLEYYWNGELIHSVVVQRSNNGRYAYIVGHLTIGQNGLNMQWINERRKMAAIEYTWRPIMDTIITYAKKVKTQ